MKQVNELLTGVILACELPSDSPEIRMFLTVQSFKKGVDGERIRWNKIIKSYNMGNDSIFILHRYSLLSEYIELNYDIHDNDLTEDVVLDNIIGWDRLYEELSKIIDDLGLLRPQWHCGNPLE